MKYMIQVIITCVAIHHVSIFLKKKKKKFGKASKMSFFFLKKHFFGRDKKSISSAISNYTLWLSYESFSILCDVFCQERVISS